VTDLADFLNAMGAKITGIGTDVLVIEGVEKLGVENLHYDILPDRIETGTYLVAAAITGGKVRLKKPALIFWMLFWKSWLKLALKLLSVKTGLSWICTVKDLKRFLFVRHLIPLFQPTLQAQFIAMNCIAEGVGVITETIFENRFMHVQELQRMGADIRLESNTAICTGVKKLTGAPVMATDLRASASLVIAALVAEAVLWLIVFIILIGVMIILKKSCRS